MRPVPYDGEIFNTRPPRSFLVKLFILILIAIADFQSISFYVDSLWFGSLGFESVYWYQLKAQSATFAAFFLASTILLWVMFRLVIPSSRGPRRPLMEFNGKPIYLPGLETARNLARPVSAV